MRICGAGADSRRVWRREWRRRQRRAAAEARAREGRLAALPRRALHAQGQTTDTFIINSIKLFLVRTDETRRLNHTESEVWCVIHVIFYYSTTNILH